MIVAAADAALLQHTPLLVVSEAGLSEELAAASLSVMFAFGIVGKIAAGRLYDARSVAGMAAWNLLVGVSVAPAFLLGGMPTLILFAVTRGLAHGGLVPMPAVLARHSFGEDSMTVTLPAFMGVWLLGAGVGPLVLAMLFDATGHYRYGLLLFAALCALAGVLLRDARPQPTGTIAWQ